MADVQKKKRRAMSVQDMVSGSPGRPEPRHRSSYSGPKRTNDASNRQQTREGSNRSTGTTFVNTVEGYGYAPKTPVSVGKSSARGGYVAPTHAGGVLDFAWIVYVAILVICLMVSMIVFAKGNSKRTGYHIPRKMFTSTGILNTIYDDFYAGGLGSSYKEPSAGDAAQAQDASMPEAIDGEVAGGSTASNSVIGASMNLDTGEEREGYTKAASYDELLTQLEQALSNGDVDFVGCKLSYADEASGNLLGYPRSVVEHFVQYMSGNGDKRAAFLSEIKGSEFAAKNGEAFIVKIPLLKFTVNMGYDNTTLSITGFSDQVLSAGQSATVQPLLPCMYTITVATGGGSQSSEIEANMNEGNLQINIGVTSE